MKYFILLLCLFVQLTAVAEDKEVELPPLDPAYVDIHGMALVTHSSSIYASHMPLYDKPHNVQLIYKIDTKSIPLIQLVRDNDLVTIKPNKFNLQRLMRGEKITINADVYMGHFERDGMLVYENMPITFAKKLYVRDFSDIKESSSRQKYDVINLKKNNRIYIHRIQKAPSYDHLIHIDIEAGCLAQFNTSSPVPKETELQYKFLNCGTMKPLYFESESFSRSN